MILTIAQHCHSFANLIQRFVVLVTLVRVPKIEYEQNQDIEVGSRQQYVQH